MLSTAIECEYKLCSDRYLIEGEYHTGYGISVVDISSGEEMMRLEDISASKSDIEELIELCNRLKLSPIHIHDVIKDHLE